MSETIEFKILKILPEAVNDSIMATVEEIKTKAMMSLYADLGHLLNARSD